MLNMMILFCLFYMAWIAFLYIMQRNFIYFPDPDPPKRSIYNAQDMDIITAMSEDGLELSAWYKKPKGNKPTIIVFHGNASHMGLSAWKLRPFIDQGYGALLPAYRGYAGNPGKPTEKGLYMDGRAFINWLLKEQGVLQKDIVLLGESLGTGVAIEMARSDYKEVQGLILESPYTSFTNMAKRNFFYVPFVSYLVRDRYENISKIDGVKAPLLIIHGVRDLVVPFKQGKALFEAANEPKSFFELKAAGHNDLYVFGAGERILQFLSDI